MKCPLSLVAGAMLLAALQGCGGGGGDGDGTQPPAGPFPVANSNVYRGVAHPGELVQLTLDPVAKTYSLAVVSSQFGVSSTPRTCSYREEAGRMIDIVDPTVTFVVANGQAYGNSKVTTGTGAAMSIAMVSTNQSTDKLTDLTGFYSFVQMTSAPDGSSAQAESGQMKIGADGKVRVCEAQGYFDACKNLDGGETIVQLVHLGDGRWNIKAGEFKLADFYPRRVDGVTSFLIDFAFADDTGPRVGTGVVASDRDLVSGSFDGTYDCFRRGRRVTLAVNGVRATDSDGSTYNFSYNRGGSLADNQWRTNAGALIAADVPGYSAPLNRMAVLPLSAKELVGSGIDSAGRAFSFACVRP